jgi:hypothetical protein
MPGERGSDHRLSQLVRADPVEQRPNCPNTCPSWWAGRWAFSGVAVGRWAGRRSR